jgi:hypothetical protein
MANSILTAWDAKVAFTISMASIANVAGRQSTLIDNSTTKRPAAKISAQIRAGAAAPTNGASYDIFLLRANAASSPTITTDNAGLTDAALTVENARLIGSLVVTATANKYFYGDWDTSHLGPLGPLWGIAIRNNSGQTTGTTAGDHIVTYEYYYPEIQ